jgi:hypothetical protein
MARLESRLNLLKRQQALSSPYPDLQARLICQELATQLQLNQLHRMRQTMV